MSYKIIVVNFHRNYFNIILFIFFSIPKNNRNLWIDILDLPSNIPNSDRICSNHFSENSFDTNGLLTRLTRGGRGDSPWDFDPNFFNYSGDQKKVYVSRRLIE